MQHMIHREDGVTLLELMFASGILALALSLLFGSLLSISLIGRLSEERTTASGVVASVLEEVRSLNLEELMTFEPEVMNGPGIEHAVGLTYFDANGTETDLPLLEGEEVPAGLPNPLRVRATLVWTDERGRVYSLDAVTEHGR